jgi:aspartate kinase
MPRKVCKFGGTSLADAEHFRKVRSIIEADPDRVVIVVSAPGKRTPDDKKVTDLLLICQELAENGIDITPIFSRVRERYESIATALAIELDVGALLDGVAQEIMATPTRDFVASRGEYICARLMAAWLDATYIEPAESILFREEGHIDSATYERLAAQLDREGLCVVPGFYGCDRKGQVKTFSRGGSDVTGAIAARAARAAVYENWTDVSGFRMADPRIVEHPRRIEELTYRELRELAYMGASVLHDEAIFPVRDAGIPIEILNTNAPNEPGTRIVASREPGTPIVTGIAGVKDFVMVQMEKTLMNKMVGFGRRVLEIFEEHDISFDHTPTGIDTMSVVVRAEALADKGPAVIQDIQRILEPDRIELITDLAIIATVGEGMIHHVGTAAKLFTALARADVNIRIIDQGSSEINIIVGIENRDFESAIRAIYHEFME